MRSSLNERWSAWKYSTERSLAPHVEEAWAEDFVVELRLQGVSGPAIGEALTEVESHCAESDESARHAFGDATEYARSLRLPLSEDGSPQAIAAATAPTVVQLGGMLFTIWAFGDWAAGSDVTFTVGQVLSLVFILGAIAGLVRFSEKGLRFVVRHPVLAFLAMMAFGALSVVALLLGTHELTTVPAVPALVVAGATLLGGAAWQRRRTRSGADEDPITSPLDGPAPQARPTSRWTALTYLTIPIYTVFSLALSWWIAQQ